MADALPLIGAADQDPDNREEFLAACLGPLHTSDRHRHLPEPLRAYLVHGLRTTPAARSLYVHRHTFRAGSTASAPSPGSTSTTPSTGYGPNSP